MKQFIQRNAITATILNLVINTIAPAIIFRHQEQINLKGDSPTLIDLLLPTVLISVFATTLATFITMTRQRTAQKLQPVLAANTNWLGTALLTSIILAVLVAGIAFLLMRAVQSLSDNVPLSKGVALALSGGVGALVALMTSFVAVQRARRVQ